MPSGVSFMRDLTHKCESLGFWEKDLNLYLLFFDHCAGCSSSAMVVSFLRRRDVADPSLYHVVARKRMIAILVMTLDDETHP